MLGFFLLARLMLLLFLLVFLLFFFLAFLLSPWLPCNKMHGCWPHPAPCSTLGRRQLLAAGAPGSRAEAGDRQADCNPPTHRPRTLLPSEVSAERKLMWVVVGLGLVRRTQWARW